MFIAPDRDNLHKIIVLNPKGGSGKTTLATNIAGFYAIRGPMPTLVDCDPSGFSSHWLEKRPGYLPRIHGVAAHDESVRDGNTVFVQTPPETQELIIDMPAQIAHDELIDITYGANSILIPVMPSAVDVYCLSRFVAELLLIAQIDRSDCQVAVVANRVRQNTNSFKSLMRFLGSLQIPLITVLRNSQNYVRAAGAGLCLQELPEHEAGQDVAQMEQIIGWLDRWRTRQPESTVAYNFRHKTPDPVIVSSTVSPWR